MTKSCASSAQRCVYGFTDRPQFVAADSTYSVADRPVALEGRAREQSRWLKNEGHHCWPLDAAKSETIAIIGPQRMAGGHRRRRVVGSSGFRAGSIVTGIANIAGPDVHILYTRGLPEMPEIFWRTKWEGGVKLATYPSKDFTGTPRRLDSAHDRRLQERLVGS